MFTEVMDADVEGGVFHEKTYFYGVILSHRLPVTVAASEGITC